MRDSEKLAKILDGLIFSVEIVDNEPVWIGEKLSWLANKIIENGFISKNVCQWKPLGQRVYGGGKSYTHYCSGCGKHGYEEDDFCPGCGAIMKKDKEKSI